MECLDTHWRSGKRGGRAWGASLYGRPACRAGDAKRRELPRLLARHLARSLRARERRLALAAALDDDPASVADQRICRADKRDTLYLIAGGGCGRGCSACV